MSASTAIEAERAGAWFRVSTKDQDEANQQPEVMKWIEDHGYEPAATYQIHGASARKGNKRFDTTWAQVLDDFRTGKIKVLVVWRLSRLDRKLAATQMIAEVVKLGGRIEFAKQPHLNDLSTMAGRISLTVEQELAFAESEEKSDRIKAKHVTLKDKGSFVGRPSWGYEIVKQDGIKTLASTPLGREWIPQVYRMAIDGHSRLDIAQRLTSAGLKTMNGNTVWSQRRITRHYHPDRQHQHHTDHQAALSAWEATDFTRNMHRDQQFRGLASNREIPRIAAPNGPFMARSRPGKGL
jgi:DNA invertase Pin-like site-specific DNA recombinase